MSRLPKHFLLLIFKRPVVIVIPVALILLAIQYQVSYTYQSSHASRRIPFFDMFTYLTSPSTVSITTFCKVSRSIQAILQRAGTSHINPARELVEELVELLAYNSSVCESNNTGEHLVVTIVNTARGHFRERELIRRTWGSVVKYKKWQVRTVFLLGQSKHCLNVTGDRKEEMTVLNEEKAVMNEYREYGDIVIGAFADTYRNLTYKHLMGYHFVLDNYPSAELIIKTDDDVFVDVPAIIDVREKELRTTGKGRSSKKPFDIYCFIYNDDPPRDPEDKWYITREEWPENTYPEYCLGGGYVISMEWLNRIFSVRSFGGFFWVDDVFVMGKLRVIAEETYGEPANIFNTATSGKFTDRRGDPNYMRQNCEKNGTKFGWFVVLDRPNPDFVFNMECLWRRVVRKVNATNIQVSKHSII